MAVQNIVTNQTWIELMFNFNFRLCEDINFNVFRKSDSVSKDVSADDLRVGILATLSAQYNFKGSSEYTETARFKYGKYK